MFSRDAGLELQRLAAEFAEKPAFPFAADLLSAAVSSGHGELARDAAESVLQEEQYLPRNVVRLARLVLAGRQGQALEKARAEGSDDTSRRIRELRHRLWVYDAGALDWMDLALAYVAIGHHRKAERAVRTALGLSKQNRHVLRSAARYLVHTKREDEAQRILTRASGFPSDPWLLAAEMAVASVAGRTSRHVRSARRIINSGQFQASDISELNAAVASIEAESGAVRSATRRMRQALLAATDNTLAQADWFSHNVAPLGDLTKKTESVPRAFEASASVNLYAEKWQESIAAAQEWSCDEPYSGRPAMHTSFVAGMILEDYALAERVLTAALRASPGDEGLMNNRAFCLASMNRVEEARRVLAGLKWKGLSGSLLVAAEATRGLIAFREQNVADGELGYRRAIEVAQRASITTSEVMARGLLARELWRAGELEPAQRELQAAEATLKRIPPEEGTIAAAVLNTCVKQEGRRRHG